MANKFTGITSAGVNVPVYDKEAHQALGNVYTKSEVDTELNTKQDNLSTEQLYNIEHALTTSAGLASEAWVNDQGFAKESDIPTTAGLMEESKLSINSNHITAYNGIPFSAQGGGGGGATYEGIAPIVVDNTENKISADTIDVNYQQITHDDSLVHVSNNAQYALGINTRMFPCDETVLWEGSLTGSTLPVSAVLAEPCTNFNRISLTMGGGYKSVHLFDGTATRLQIFSPYVGSSAASIYALNYTVDNSKPCIKLETGNSVFFKISANNVTNFDGNKKPTVGENTLIKVVGIGRKGGN